MPPSQLMYRRRFSLAALTFAHNVTHGTFDEADLIDDLIADPSLPSAQLFPPSELPAQPAARRRAPPGKRRSLGYIPRPPNAFVLFRADFVARNTSQAR
ncbi:hypothetical protein SCLCIDRAFT_18884 [Scleroderma citrinum Foug A]|uniref:Uncharacterized protein n=1 Tax=Scleroderma citrinum Foug A TaxID=1036808 RepID=A0A0C3B0X1_9AGAM|nr:hypothetical protein SCLCIDRAFT_18884 [Scleroderma citrinum Foug A]